MTLLTGVKGHSGKVSCCQCWPSPCAYCQHGHCMRDKDFRSTYQYEYSVVDYYTVVLVGLHKADVTSGQAGVIMQPVATGDGRCATSTSRESHRLFCTFFYFSSFSKPFQAFNLFECDRVMEFQVVCSS